MTGLADFQQENVGASYILLALVNPLAPPKANNPIRIAVALDPLAEDAGLVPPLELLFLSPTAALIRVLFETFVPSEIAVTPREGGPHLVTLGEVDHNRWRGELELVVAGDSLRP